MEKHRSSMNQREIYRVLTENPPMQNAAERIQHTERRDMTQNRTRRLLPYGPVFNIPYLLAHDNVVSSRSVGYH